MDKRDIVDDTEKLRINNENKGFIKSKNKKPVKILNKIKNAVIGLTIVAVTFFSGVALSACNNTTPPGPGPDVPPIVKPVDPDKPENPDKPGPDKPTDPVDKDAPSVKAGAQNFLDGGALYNAFIAGNYTAKVMVDETTNYIYANKDAVQMSDANDTKYYTQEENGIYAIEKQDGEWKKNQTDKIESLNDVADSLFGESDLWKYDATAKAYKNGDYTLTLDGALATMTGKDTDGKDVKAYAYDAGVTSKITLPEIQGPVIEEPTLEEKIAASKQAFVDSVYKTAEYIQANRVTERATDLGSEKINKVVTVQFDEANKKKITVFLDVFPENNLDGINAIKSYYFEATKEINVKDIIETGTFTGFAYAKQSAQTVGRDTALNMDSSLLSKENYIKFKDKFKLNDYEYVHVAAGGTADSTWRFTTFKNGVKTLSRIRVANTGNANYVFENFVLKGNYIEDNDLWNQKTVYYDLNDANTLDLSAFQRTVEEETQI